MLNRRAKATTLVLETVLSNTTDNEAPPLYPQLPPGELEKMSLQEQADYLFERGKSPIARYGGRPELMLKENPHLDFQNPPQKAKPPA
jgi:hypothetical protein